jgi:hypothetical protein
MSRVGFELTIQVADRAKIFRISHPAATVKNEVYASELADQWEVFRYTSLA